MRPPRRRARHNGRKRDLSIDPKYRRHRNFNKPARANRITTFPFCKRCGLANRVDRRKWAQLELNDGGVFRLQDLQDL